MQKVSEITSRCACGLGIIETNTVEMEKYLAFALQCHQYHFQCLVGFFYCFLLLTSSRALRLGHACSFLASCWVLFNVHDQDGCFLHALFLLLGYVWFLHAVFDSSMQCLISPGCVGFSRLLPIFCEHGCQIYLIFAPSPSSACL